MYYNSLANYFSFSAFEHLLSLMLNFKFEWYQRKSDNMTFTDMEISMKYYTDILKEISKLIPLFTKSSL